MYYFLVLEEGWAGLMEYGDTAEAIMREGSWSQVSM